MTTEDDDDKLPLGKRQERRISEAWQILTTNATREDMVFLAREFILCTLPHRNPGDVPAWSRTNGNLTLTIRPGWNHDKKVAYGYPYGTIPRLLLVWIVTEVVRTKSRRLQLGNSLSSFMAALGLNSSNGGTGAKRSDARRLREQMERLFRAIISFDYSLKGDGRKGHAWMDMQVAPDGVLWWNDDVTDEDAVWGSWIEVSEQFYKAIMAEPTPLDIRILKHVKHSSMAIDLYTILNREAYRANKAGRAKFLAWSWLHAQIGNEYGALDNFRRAALPQLKTLLEVHSGLIVSQQKGRTGQKSGLWVSNLSTPSIDPGTKFR